MKVYTLSDRAFIYFIVLILKVPLLICVLFKLIKYENKLEKIMENLIE